MATLGDLVIKLSMDAAGFISDMGKASYQAEKFASQIRDRFHKASESAKTLGDNFGKAVGNLGGEFGEGLRKAGETVKQVTEAFSELSHTGGKVVGVFGAVVIAAAAVTAAMTLVALSVQKQVSEMSDAAAASQIQADAFQAIAIGAAQSGISVSELSGMLNKFNRQVVEAAEGSNQAAENFASLGVKVTQGGRLRDTEAVLGDVARAITKMGQGAQKAALELDFFGKTGTRAEVFLREYEERTKAAAASGAIFGPQLRAQAVEYEKAAAQAEGAIQGFKNEIAMATLPTLITLLKLFKEWTDSLGTAEQRAQRLATMTTVLTTSIKGLAVVFLTVVDAIELVRDILLDVNDILGLVAITAVKLGEGLQKMGLFRTGADALKPLDFSAAIQSFKDIGAAAEEAGKRIADRWNKPLRSGQFLEGFNKTLASVKDQLGKAGEHEGEAGDRGALARSFAKQQEDARALADKVSKEAERGRREAQQAFTSSNADTARQASLTTISIEDEFDKRIAAQQAFTARSVAEYDKEIAAAERLRDAVSSHGVPLLDSAGRTAQGSKIADLQQRQKEATNASTEAEKQLAVQRELANRAYTRQVQEVNASVEELHGNLVEAASIRFDSANQDLILRTYAEANQKQIQQLATLKELTVQQVKFNAELQEVERIRNASSRTEAVIAAQVKSGRLTDFEAAAATNDLRRRTIALNTQEIEKLQAIGALTADQKARIADLAAENAVLAASIDQVGKAINDAFIGAASDALVEFVEHTKSAQEAFNDFAKSVVHAINQMIAQELAKKLFRSMFGEDTQSGAAGIGGFLSQLFGASGGGAGAGGSALAATSTTTTVAFANAMASGGSFSPNELLLVGEKGPELIRPSFSGQVIPNAQMAGGNVNVNMSINTPDASSFQRSQGQILTQMALASQRALARR